MISDLLPSLNAEQWRPSGEGEYLKGKSGCRYPTIMLMIKTHSDICHEFPKTETIEFNEFN